MLTGVRITQAGLPAAFFGAPEVEEPAKTLQLTALAAPHIEQPITQSLFMQKAI
jgi:hypothetical protein